MAFADINNRSMKKQKVGFFADQIDAASSLQRFYPVGNLASFFDRTKFEAHCAPPVCLRSKAASTEGQWNKTRLPPGSRTQGILPVSRQANSVRRETGRRFNSSFSSMKLASPGDACCSDVFNTPAFWRRRHGFSS